MSKKVNPFINMLDASLFVQKKKVKDLEAGDFAILQDSLEFFREKENRHNLPFGVLKAKKFFGVVVDKKSFIMGHKSGACLVYDENPMLFMGYYFFESLLSLLFSKQEKTNLFFAYSKKKERKMMDHYDVFHENVEILCVKKEKVKEFLDKIKTKKIKENFFN